MMRLTRTVRSKKNQARDAPKNAIKPKVVKETIRPNFTNYRVEGSLAKSHELPCISLEQAKNIYTPADIYPSVAKCIIEGKKSAELFFLASVYAIYDTLRVADKTVGGTRKMLIMKHLESIDSAEKKAAFTKETEVFSDPNSLEAIRLCKNVKKIGRPNYHPQYMISHGMAAVTGRIKGNGLKKDYNEQELWAKALVALRGCN